MGPGCLSPEMDRVAVAKHAGIRMVTYHWQRLAGYYGHTPSKLGGPGGWVVQDTRG